MVNPKCSGELKRQPTGRSQNQVHGPCHLTAYDFKGRAYCSVTYDIIKNIGFSHTESHFPGSFVPPGTGVEQIFKQLSAC